MNPIAGHGRGVAAGTYDAECDLHSVSCLLCSAYSAARLPLTARASSRAARPFARNSAIAKTSRSYCVAAGSTSLQEAIAPFPLLGPRWPEGQVGRGTILGGAATSARTPNGETTTGRGR